MRMTNPLFRRLSALEAALRPAGRVFVVWDDGDGTIDEKIAAFRAENDVQPRDVIHTISFLWDRDPEPAQ
jgi:hypothetical protein